MRTCLPPQRGRHAQAERRERRPDVVLFVNGLPLAVIELKNPADENADIWRAFNQLQTYKQQIPSLFVYNAALLVSDGAQARIGTLTADREWFLPWRTITGEELAAPHLPERSSTATFLANRQNSSWHGLNCIRRS